MAIPEPSISKSRATRRALLPSSAASGLGDPQFYVVPTRYEDGSSLLSILQCPVVVVISDAKSHGKSQLCPTRTHAHAPYLVFRSVKLLALRGFDGACALLQLSGLLRLFQKAEEGRDSVLRGEWRLQLGLSLHGQARAPWLEGGDTKTCKNPRQAAARRPRQLWATLAWV
jgi:hypothetical protein